MHTRRGAPSLIQWFGSVSSRSPAAGPRRPQRRRRTFRWAATTPPGPRRRRHGRRPLPRTPTSRTSTSAASGPAPRLRYGPCVTVFRIRRTEGAHAWRGHGFVSTAPHHLGQAHHEQPRQRVALELSRRRAAYAWGAPGGRHDRHVLILRACARLRAGGADSTTDTFAQGWRAQCKRAVRRSLYVGSLISHIS